MASLTAPPGFGARPLEGGYSGETFLVDGPEGPAVLRVYGRDPHRAAIDAALMHLVRGILPVPRVLDLRRPAPGDPDAPAHLLCTFEPGRRLELVLPHVDPALRHALASSVADVLALLSGMPYLRAAEFVDADLNLSQDPPGAPDLVAWLDQHVAQGSYAHWDAGLLAALRDLCAHGDEVLDAVRRICLVHSDFNPKNLLVDPGSGLVTAVLDWEFSHAGSPYADLGNLLRFERGTRWAHDVVEQFVARAPEVADQPLTLAYASDLWSLVSLAASPVRHRIAEAADVLLREMARAGDLHARPS